VVVGEENGALSVEDGRAGVGQQTHIEVALHKAATNFDQNKKWPTCV
jgi:hypothetical protein